MDKRADLLSDSVEVVPVVVLSQTFPARPSSSRTTSKSTCCAPAARSGRRRAWTP